MKTSSAAPPRRPSFRASTTAASSSSLPRPMLMSSAPRLMASSAGRPMSGRGLRRQRRRQHEDIGPREELRAAGRAATTSSTRTSSGTWRVGVLAHGRNPQAERARPAARPRADRSQPDNREPAARAASGPRLADSISSSAQRCSAWRRSTSGSCRASAMVMPITCSAIARARTPRALVSTIGLATSSSESRWPTPAAGRLHPAQPAERRHEVAIDERGKRHVGVGQRPPERLAIPDVDERVRGKLAAQPIDERPRQHPGLGRTDDADHDVHGMAGLQNCELSVQRQARSRILSPAAICVLRLCALRFAMCDLRFAMYVPLLPPALYSSAMSPMTIALSTALTMS